MIPASMAGTAGLFGRGDRRILQPMATCWRIVILQRATTRLRTELLDARAAKLLVALGLSGCQGGPDAVPSTATGAGASHGRGEASASASNSRATTDTHDGPPGECIPWMQDCPDDLDKCMPWSLEDDRLPDEYRCCPVASSTAAIGDLCEIDDYDGSCRDNCEKGAVCILDRPDVLTGYCHEFCNTTTAECGLDEFCKSFFEVIETVPNVPVCMKTCDPLVQDCARPDWSCLPDNLSTAGRSGFICTPPPPSTPSGVAQPCTLGNDCEIGLLCITGDRVPGCETASCCTAFCSNDDKEYGNDSCSTGIAGTECVDWESPDPRWQDVGVCATSP
jgi:hypothetical protein